MPERLRRLARLGLAAFGVLCAGVVGLAVSSPLWERAAPTGAAIVVLGAGLGADGALGPAGQARMARGIALWQTGAAPLLIVTDGPVAAPLMAARARDAGLPEAALLVDARAASTLQNALNLRAMLEPSEAGPVILVTEGYHVARARASFAWAGVPVAGHAISTVFRPGPLNAAKMVLREALGWPFNFARVLVWHAGALFGVDDAARLRWLA